MSTDLYFNWVLGSITDFANLPIREQIVMFALGVAIIVLSLALTYWTVKGTLYLTYYIVKGSLYLSYYSVKLSLWIPFMIIRIILNPIREEKSVSQQPNIVQNPSPQATLYCSQCGKQFTTAMEQVMHKSGNCFCEHCGVKTDLRT